MQQIVSSISIRNKNRDRVKKQEISWIVSTLSQVMIAGYQAEDVSNALESASKFTIDDIALKIQEADLPPEPIEPKKGSTEKLMRAFSQLGG